MRRERAVVIVRGHTKADVTDQLALPGLRGTVAVVLSPYRLGVPHYVLDHELWLACMTAVTRTVDAQATEVFGTPTRRFWELFRKPRSAPHLGAFDRSGTFVGVDSYLGLDISERWHELRWRRDAQLLAIAHCERWYCLGGPDIYHDSYTSRVLIGEERVDELIAEIAISVERVGGWVEDIVDAD